MRKKAFKAPKQSEVGPVYRALLQFVPTDIPLVSGMRESLKHVPNYRIRGVTNEITWTVDVYHRGWFFAQVGDVHDYFEHIPPLLNFLLKYLRVTE